MWEYVKYEIAQGRINPHQNYNEDYKEPILLDINNAKHKDSLAVDVLIEELKERFPSKRIVYFSDYVGKGLIAYTKDRGDSSTLNESYDEILSYTISIIFDPTISSNGSGVSSLKYKDMGLEVPKFIMPKWNINYHTAKLFFSFNKDVSIDDRAKFMSSNFYSFMLSIHFAQFRPYDIELQREYRSVHAFDHLTKPHKMVGGYIKDYKFLLGKIFSNDFKKQFENYMYQTYPWRYASVFLDKEKEKQNASAIVGFVGLLILLLSCSLFWVKKNEYSFLNYFYPMLIFAIGIYSLNSLYGYLIYIDVSKVALLGELVTLIAICLLVLIVSFLFWKIENKMANIKPGFGYQIIIKSWLTFLFLYLLFIIGITHSFEDYVFGVKMNLYLNDLQILFLIIGLTFARVILIYLNHFSESLVKQKDVELSRLKEINAQSELKLLQSHINPHFLYNALNSIAGLAHSNADKTEKMALSLSDLFRYSINKKGEKMSTVKEEVTMVQNYLEIEKIRFGDRLTFQLNIDETILDKNIPMYILQPLVENAIKHGISKIGGDAKIGLEIIKEQNNLLIVVSDNGPEFPKGLVSGHGLQTVNDLLRLSYGENALLKWENTPEKKITITILKTA